MKSDEASPEFASDPAERRAAAARAVGRRRRRGAAVAVALAAACASGTASAAATTATATAATAEASGTTTMTTTTDVGTGTSTPTASIPTTRTPTTTTPVGSRWTSTPWTSTPLQSANRRRPGAQTEPARGLDLFDVPGSGPLGRRGGAPRRTANETSTNWAGYVAGHGPFTTVAANWTEPDVTCTSNGIVAFWVGLDGFGSDSVEQDGTGVDCSDGTPQHFAWWETYPANSIQEYDDPVSAGDHLASTVTSEPGGVYAMVLTDATKGWTERTTAKAAGARNASAEIVTEAVTTGNTISPLPDFHAVAFTGAQIDGASLQAAGAVPVDMTNGTGALIATTQQADASGDFQVRYAGAAAPLSRTGRHATAP